MWPSVSTVVLCNETPSATLCFMAVSMCCDANEPLLPQTPPLIVLFDLLLIRLIRSPTFKVKRFVSTSECASPSVQMCTCESIKKRINTTAQRERSLEMISTQGYCRAPERNIHLSCEIHYFSCIIGIRPHVQTHQQADIASRSSNERPRHEIVFCADYSRCPTLHWFAQRHM